MTGTAEGHDSRPWLGRPALKVGVRPPTGEEADAPQILTRASLGALGATQAIALGIPVFRPSPWHAVSIAPRTRPGQHASGRLPESDQARTARASVLVAGPEPGALVFPDAKGGPLRRGNFNKALGLAARRAAPSPWSG